ncbi:glycosyltransferase family 2 protein [Microbacterium marinilacus]|uniref:Glycosyltransferase 2-like domain-containing protein n=1 Tax=Microbacterium marinilacus TaxID=415209 RepID=A0ABP7BPH7_9MICO|nr:glycosyltransferase family A protein [Microbacterium marinilacus]MBY0690044.1 glycosyltransferase family 2 protein [Microbacterium marinilacus]
MSAPRVSVVVATNRTSPHLAEALESACRQTLVPVEIIVVDDGSPDAAAVAEVAASAGARIVRLPPSGVSVARNVGVTQASGEYVAFLDDDDRWAPERLRLQAAALASDPGAVASYCGMRTVDEAGVQELAPADQVAVASRLDVARRLTGIILPNLLIRRTALDAVGGFHSRLRLAEDLDLVLRLAERGTFRFVPEQLVDYRATSTNTTRRHRELARGIEEVLRLHQAAASAAGDVDLVAALGESLRANARFAWWAAGRRARALVRDGRPARAAGELWWALGHAPGGLVDGLSRRLGSAGKAPERKLEPIGPAHAGAVSP